jgi:hypothetical protein
MANVRDKVTVVRWLVSRNAAPVLAHGFTHPCEKVRKAGNS